MKRALMMTVTGLMFAALVGCQSASRPWWAKAGVHVREAPSPRVQRARVHHMSDRVHVVLADYAPTPMVRQAAAVALGAGDPLGRQIFERYALAVEMERRREQSPKLAEATPMPTSWYEHVLTGQ